MISLLKGGTKSSIMLGILIHIFVHRIAKYHGSCNQTDQDVLIGLLYVSKLGRYHFHHLKPTAVNGFQVIAITSGVLAAILFQIHLI